jgi:hypothetical protein
MKKAVKQGMLYVCKSLRFLLKFKLSLNFKSLYYSGLINFLDQF